MAVIPHKDVPEVTPESFPEGFDAMQLNHKDHHKVGFLLTRGENGTTSYAGRGMQWENSWHLVGDPFSSKDDCKRFAKWQVGVDRDVAEFKKHELEVHMKRIRIPFCQVDKPDKGPKISFPMSVEDGQILAGVRRALVQGSVSVDGKPVTNNAQVIQYLLRKIPEGTKY